MGTPGRPSLYNPSLGEEICRLIAEGGSLRKICEREDMPGLRTVLDWLNDPGKAEFRAKYAQARADQQDVAADQQVDVAQQAAEGKIDAAAARVLCEALRWRAAKLRPKVYGDKVGVEHSGEIGLAQLVSRSIEAPAQPTGGAG